MSQHEIETSNKGSFYQNAFQLLEAIHADAVANQIAKLCPENECNVNDGWRTYGMKAIERVNDKCWIWKSFVEAARILKIDYDME